MKLRITATGTRPLLLHNVRLASPLDPYAKKLKALNAKRVKTDEDRLEVARVEWEGGLYFDETIGPYIPAPNVLASLIGGARLIKAGKKIERGVLVSDLELPLLYRGPRTREALWGDGSSDFVDLRTVRVGQAKVDRCRPMFREWSFEADVEIDPAVIDEAEFAEVVRLAGAMEGIGDYRRMYGRFEALVEPV